MSCFTRVQEVSLSKGAAKHGPVSPNRAVVLVRVLARDFASQLLKAMDSAQSQQHVWIDDLQK